MTEREEARKLAKSAPPLNEKELAEINDCYIAYIFRNRKKREIWTTCCGRHEIIPKSEYTDAQHAVMEAVHEKEERGYGLYCHAAYAPPSRKRETTPCPYCGKDAYVKELGRTGKRDNLASYKRFVVLRWHKGFLWARAYYTAKKYGDNGKLTARPSWTLHKIYRFKPGEALCASRIYYDGEFEYVKRMTERPKKLPLPFYEPFSYNSAEGSGYTLIGKSEIGKSHFKYCQYEDFFGHSCSYMRFLAICCIYPRQVEMLMKTGMSSAVNDLVEGRKWNAAAFNWDEPDPLVSFGLDKNEMKDYLAGGKNLEALAYYKQFRHKKIKCTIAEVEEAMRQSPYMKAQSVIKRLKDYKIEPGRWISFMARETKAVNENKKRQFTATRDLAQFWIDYIDAAEALGYDLTNPLMQMPKGIKKKHDAAVKAAAPVIAARREKELGEKAKTRLEQATARYGFAFEQYIIRAPIDTGEIVNEGKTLKHCVGGYAERHMNGKLTILFLRSAADPYTPMVTIEMMGNNLVQIHGYDNDSRSKIPPREKYASVLDPWLDWVKTGSKRDDDGNPILKRKRQPRQRVLAAVTA